MTLPFGVTTGTSETATAAAGSSLGVGVRSARMNAVRQCHDPRWPAFLVVLQVADPALDHLAHAVGRVGTISGTGWRRREHVGVHATRAVSDVSRCRSALRCCETLTTSPVTFWNTVGGFSARSTSSMWATTGSRSSSGNGARLVTRRSTAWPRSACSSARSRAASPLARFRSALSGRLPMPVRSRTRSSSWSSSAAFSRPQAATLM